MNRVQPAPMQTYTFTGPKSETTIVQAASEKVARHKAMVARWGPPTGIYTNPYWGLGLNLVKVED